MIPRVCAVWLALCLTSCHAIWPAPKQLHTGSCVLSIAQNVTVTLNGNALDFSCPPPPPTQLPTNLEIIQAAALRAATAVFEENIVPWKLRPRGSAFEPDADALEAGPSVSSIDISLPLNSANSPNAVVNLTELVDESYTLSLTTTGIMTICANSSIGVLRAFDTAVQLFYSHSCGTLAYTNLAPVTIADSPTYSHRGVLLDVARSYYPIPAIQRTIDAMSWNKLNRLHIHITDSQSWPLVIPTMPDLAAKGAYSPFAVYTPDDFKALQIYGYSRGVIVITEIDMPSHIGSVANAYPDLIVAYNKLPYYYWCAEPPCGSFKLNDVAVFSFLAKLWNDLLPRIAPYSPYFHTGGDELNANLSAIDPTVLSSNASVITPLLQKFTDYNHVRIREAGLTPMVWEEIPIQWGVKLGKDVVVQTWLGADSVAKATALGNRIIDSDYNFWYLDCGRGQWLNFDNGASYQNFYPFSDYCAPARPWQLVYSHDPAAGLPPAQACLVLGGEVAVWGETIDSVSVDTITWPRAAAAAEVLWSGRIDPATGVNRTLSDAATRLAEMRERMVARGVLSAPVHMTYCSQETPEYCAFPLPPP